MGNRAGNMETDVEVVHLREVVGPLIRMSWLRSFCYRAFIVISIGDVFIFFL